MKKLSLKETHTLLKKYNHVIFDEETSGLNSKLNDDGLIITLKSGNNKSVMLFPHEKNESVEITKTTVTLYDSMGWVHNFIPLMNADLI
jgi:hypothetical protein